MNCPDYWSMIMYMVDTLLEDHYPDTEPDKQKGIPMAGIGWGANCIWAYEVWRRATYVWSKEAV